MDSGDSSNSGSMQDQDAEEQNFLNIPPGQEDQQMLGQASKLTDDGSSFGTLATNVANSRPCDELMDDNHSKNQDLAQGDGDTDIADDDIANNESTSSDNSNQMLSESDVRPTGPPREVRDDGPQKHPNTLTTTISNDVPVNPTTSYQNPPSFQSESEEPPVDNNQPNGTKDTL